MKSNIIIVVITFVLISFSCKKKFDFENYDVTLANVFSGYGDDIEKDIVFLNRKVKIKKSILASTSNGVVDSINIVIGSYYDYLNELDLKSSELNKNLFYEEDILTAEGKNFMVRSEKFLVDLDRLVVNEDVKDYLRHFFNIDDVKNTDDTYFLYMEYHYLGIPYPTFKFLIKRRKYDLITFQNEVLNSYLIKK